VRQQNLMDAKVIPITRATATTQGINDDDACATCSYELGTSVAGSNRNCQRCENYHLAQIEAARVKKEREKADDWSALAAAAGNRAKREAAARITATDDAIIVETKANTTKEEEAAALLPVLAKALKPHLEISDDKFDSIRDRLENDFANLAAELRDSQKQIHITRVEISTDAGATITDAGIQHKLFPRLVKMLSARDHKNHRLNIWIAGPAGTGKTSAAEHAAKALGLEFSSYGSLQDTYKIFGFYSPGTGQYIRTQFRERWEHGGIILLDDFDGSDPAACVEFCQALANGGCTFPDGYIERHPDCVIILTANTWGLGATNDYVGRMKQDAAFLDRFAKLHWPIDEDLELATAPIEAWTRRVQEIRANVKTKGLKVLVTPRASYYGAALLQAGLTQEETEESVLKAAMSDDQWRSVQ
jgi:adenylate kinase